MRDSFFCDNCAKSLPRLQERFVVSQLPCDIDSANEGESAVLCQHCFKHIMEDTDDTTI